MKKFLCWVVGHDWVVSGALTTIFGTAWPGHTQITVYKCRRCGIPGVQ